MRGTTTPSTRRIAIRHGEVPELDGGARPTHIQAAHAASPVDREPGAVDDEPLDIFNDDARVAARNVHAVLQVDVARQDSSGIIPNGIEEVRLVPGVLHRLLSSRGRFRRRRCCCCSGGARLGDAQTVERREIAPHFVH